jgi:DNA topoisomerase-1
MSIDLNRAIEIIEAKRQAEKEKIIKIFEENEEVKVLNGRFGPYIAIGKNNYKIPKGTDPAALSLEDCLKLASEQDANNPNKKAYLAPKKQAEKKETSKKKTTSTKKIKATTKKSSKKK